MGSKAKGQTGSLAINRDRSTFVQNSDINGEWLILRGLCTERVSGNTYYKCDNADSSLEDIIKTDKYGNILIYDPEYKNKNPVYYKYPNIIVPKTK